MGIVTDGFTRDPSSGGAGGPTALSGLTDANVSGPSDGNALVFLSSDSKWHNEKRPARTFEEFNGSQSAASIQTAAWTAARAWSDAVGGGTVLFGAGTYPHMPPLELGNHMKIQGVGMRTSILRFDASIASGACVFNHVSTNGTTDGNAFACAVESLCLDCSLLPGWGNAGSASGIIWNQNPQFGSKANPGDNAELSDDAMHIVRDVFIWQPPLDGCVASGMGGQFWSNVQCYSSGRYGFQPPFDSVCVGLISGFALAEGFLISGDPVRLVGCKAFASGNGTIGTDGAGFRIKNGPVSLVNCESQDCTGPGFFVDSVGAAPVDIVGCICDSNSVGGVGSWPAIDIAGSTNVRVMGTVCQERRVDGVHSYQQHAVSLRIDSIASIGLVHTAVSGASVGSPFQAIGTGDVGAGSRAAFCDINNLQGFQSNFSATFSPDFFAGSTVETLGLAGAATVGAPVNGPYPKGIKVLIVFKQDATGTRTITWNAIFVNTPTTNTAANAYTIGRFMWDGTSWVGS